MINLRKILTPYITVSLLLLGSHPAWAVNLAVEAVGADQSSSRKNALSALSESVWVDIKSEFQMETHSSGHQDAMKSISTVSDMPLLGVSYQYDASGREVICRATIDSGVSLPLYKSAIERQKIKIAEIHGYLVNEKDAKKRYPALNRLLEALDQLDRYLIVASFFGEAIDLDLPINAQKVRSELLSIESSAPDLGVAADILSRDLPAARIFQQAILPQGSQEATALSRELQKALATRLDTVTEPGKSEFILKGTYELHDEGKGGISVQIQLVQSGLVAASRVAMLAPSAYQHTAYQPRTLDFNRLLHEGFVVSSEFSASLQTNHGNQGLVFAKGEVMEILARLNAPGYFYIVGHNPKDKVSYLLPLQEGSERRSFIRFVNADDVNRWLSLGQFEVILPFGAEHLQLIASSEDLINNLPATRFDPKLGMHVLVADDQTQAVTKTRGLRPKPSQKKKSAEATLTFVSFAQ